MPSIAITRSYEAMYIVDPDLNEEQVSAITGRYRQVVETAGGSVEKIDVWERRRLAYEIKGRTEGIYVVMFFRGEAPVEAELRRVFQISEDQFRYIIVKPGEEDNAGLPAGAPEPAVARVAAPVVPETVAAEAPVEAPETPVASAEADETPVPAEAPVAEAVGA